MVQIKQLKNDKKSLPPKQGKQQSKVSQLQFASSDEEDSENEEMEPEDFEDEDLGEEELDVEDLEGEDELEEDEFEDEEESDEDTGPLTKTPVKGLLKGLERKEKPTLATPKSEKNGAGDTNGKTPKSAMKSANVEPATSAKSKKNVDLSAVPSPTPTKTPSTPHPAATKSKGKEIIPSAKATPMEVDTPQNKKNLKEAAPTPTTTTSSKKRKANDEDNVNGTPSAKLARNEDIISEEQRRRDERNKRTLFVKGAGKVARKSSELKGLHPDVVSVRTVGLNAWLVFANEASCNKAYEQLCKAKVKGQSLNVDFCGQKSKNAQAPKPTVNRPINKKAIMIQGLPNDITAEKLKIIFPAAKEVEIPHKKKKSMNCLAFIKFASEYDAQAAFRKGESLKVGGLHVEVLFAREPKSNADSSTSSSSSVKAVAKSGKIQPTKAEQKQNKANTVEKAQPVSKKEQKGKKNEEESPEPNELVAQIAEQQKKLMELQKQLSQKSKKQQPAQKGKQPAQKGKQAMVNGNVKKGMSQPDSDDVDSSSGDDDDDIPSSEEGIEETDSDE